MWGQLEEDIARAAGAQVEGTGRKIAAAHRRAERPGDHRRAGAGCVQQSLVAADRVYERIRTADGARLDPGAVKERQRAGVVGNGEVHERRRVCEAHSLLLGRRQALLVSLAALRISGIEPVVPGGRFREARRPFGVVEIVVGPHRHHGGPQCRISGEVTADVDVLLALEIGYVAVAERQQDGGVDSGRNLPAKGSGPDQHEALNLPGIIGPAVDRRALNPFPAAAVADQHDLAHFHAAPEASAPRVAANGGPFRPLRKVMAHELRAGRGPAVDEESILSVDAIRRDRDDQVALGCEDIGDVAIARVARYGAPSVGARPVAGGFAVRAAAIAGAVATVEKEHERHGRIASDRRGDFGIDLDRRRIVGNLKAGELIAQPLRSKAPGRARIESRGGNRRLERQNSRRCDSCGGGPVDASTRRPNRQLGQRLAGRYPQTETIGLLNRVAEQPRTGTKFIAGASDAKRRSARPGEPVAFELPARRQLRRKARGRRQCGGRKDQHSKQVPHTDETRTHGGC